MTEEDESLTVLAATGVLANDSDPEGDALTASLVTSPGSGTLIPNPDGSFAYTPNANFNGTDSFTYVANDGTGDSNTATVTLTVKPVNDAPTLDLIADPAAIDEDAGQQTVSLAGISAGGGESQTLQVTATSSNPGLIPDPVVTYTSPQATGSLAYTPVADQNGSAVITVTVTDAGLDGTLGTADDGSVSRTFTVTVNPVNDAPVAGSDVYRTTEDTPLTVAVPGVLANDTDVDGDR